MPDSVLNPGPADRTRVNVNQPHGTRSRPFAARKSSAITLQRGRAAQFASRGGSSDGGVVPWS